jgi:tRNA dimethylallyltransferase
LSKFCALTDRDRDIIAGPVVALIGPTAVGKTSLSLTICHECNAEIVSVDSMQVYRYMDIGTAKATPAERAQVPHHLIDIVDPDQDYHAASFVQDCLAAIADIHQRGAVALLTGGTGLYLQALKSGLFEAPAVDGEIRTGLKQRLGEEGSTTLHQELHHCDPATAERLHPHDGVRIIRALEVFETTGRPMSEHIREQARRCGDRFLNFITIGLTCPRNQLYKRINKRSRRMVESGLEAEVRGLLAMGYKAELKSMQSIGYRHMLNYINGAWSQAETLELLARDTRRYAKRQYTWFNRDQSIRWFEPGQREMIMSSIRSFLNRA